MYKRQGEYSVKSGWFNSETMLYMAFVTIANYSQASFEMGYACLLYTSSEYRTFKAGISRFFNSLRMTRHRGQTLVE